MAQDNYFDQFAETEEDYFSQFPALEDAPIPKEIKTEGRSNLGKAWDWANTSVFGVNVPPMERLLSKDVTIDDIQRAGFASMTTPLSLLGEAGGAAKGISLLRGLKARPKIGAPIKGQELLNAGTYEVTPGGTVRGSRNVTSIREQLGGKLPKEGKLSDIQMNRVQNIYNPTGKSDGPIQLFEKPPKIEGNVTFATKAEMDAAQPAKIKISATDAVAYMDGIKTGQIPKGTTFAQFKERLTKLTSEETGAVRVSGKEPLLPRGVNQKAYDKIQSDVINALRSGDLIDLNQIARNSKLPRRTFDKIIDKVINSGELSKIKKATEIKENQSVVKLLHALDVAKPLREQQEAIYSAERSRRFAAFSDTLQKGEGRAGFDKSLSQLSGEMPKIAPVQLNNVEIDDLFNMIKNARILPGEKAHAGAGLKKLLDGTGLPQRSELALLDKVYGQGFAQSLIEMHGGFGVVGKIKDVGTKFTKTSNTMKSMNSTLDASAPLRQGFGLIYRKEFWKSWKDMYGYMDENKFNALNKYLEERPTYLLGREHGLYLAGKELGAREEQFLSSYLDDIALKGRAGKLSMAPTRAAERMYVGFLNKLRADTFDNLLKNAIKTGQNPKEIAPHIAKFVNTFSGRGDLYKGFKTKLSNNKLFNLRNAGDELNSVFFSPRLISSRLTMLNPKYYYDAPTFIRREALKSWLAMGTFVATANGLAKAGGAEITLDPRNSDFGKMKFGNSRLDPMGGLSQVIVAAARFASGKTISPTSGNERILGEGYASPNRLSLIAGVGGNQKSFMENKLSPMAGLIDVLLSNKDFSGQPPEIKKEIATRFVPIIMQDFYKIAEEDPDLLWMLLPAMHGMGAQTFEPRQRNINPPEMNLNLNP